jgi:hypothetical protein
MTIIHECSIDIIYAYSIKNNDSSIVWFTQDFISVRLALSRGTCNTILVPQIPYATIHNTNNSIESDLE